MRNIFRGLIATVFVLTMSMASAAVNVNPSHHTANPAVSSTQVPPDFSTCDFTIPTTFGNTWWFDPINGKTEAAWTTAGISMNPAVTPHQGDQQHPWNSAQAIFMQSAFNNAVAGYTAGLWNQMTTQTTLSPIHSGDLILLMNGDYGPLAMGGFNVENNANGPKLTIMPAPGQTGAIIDTLSIQNVSNIAFQGFTVQSIGTLPLFRVGDNFNNNLVLSHNVVFDHMTIQSAPYASTASWTQAQWASNARGGFFLGRMTCLSMTNNLESVVNTGVAFQGASQVQYVGNDLSYFASDGIDYHDDDLLISRNKIYNFINLGNGDHIDGMQGIIGAASFPVSHRITIDSNYVVYQLDPNLPFVSGVGITPAAVNGGIGETNGIYVNVYKNNNIVVWNNVDAISANGCSFCGIESNTITNQGTGIEVVGSDHTVVRNNLTPSLSCTSSPPSNRVAPGAAGTIQTDHNVLLKGGSGFIDFCENGIQTHFSGSGIAAGNYGSGNIIDTGGIASEIQQYSPATFQYNFHLLSTAPARGAGAAVDFTPAGDSNGTPLNSPPDVGAVQFP